MGGGGGGGEREKGSNLYCNDNFTCLCQCMPQKSKAIYALISTSNTRNESTQNCEEKGHKSVNGVMPIAVITLHSITMPSSCKEITHNCKSF